jgi:hypothetical protein
MENVVTMDETTGCWNGKPHDPTCSSLDAEPGLAIERHILLRSPGACCAQTTLPFWARIILPARNDAEEERLASVTITLFDATGVALAEYSDVLALEGGETGEFDVKLVEHGDRTATYTVFARFVAD